MKMLVPTPNPTTTTTDDQCTSIDEERRGIPTNSRARLKGQNPQWTATVWVAAHERDERIRRGGYRFSFSAEETQIITDMRIGKLQNNNILESGDKT